MTSNTPTPKDPLEAAALEAAKQPRRGTGEHLLSRLLSPTEKRPEQFKGALTARGVNWLLDKRTGRAKVAEECEVGQSTALCVDALMPTGLPGSNSPIGYLGTALFRYVSSLVADDPVPEAKKQ
ncbi:MAG: hypothetical protein KY455_10210 [Euryarchaeota archaeon]|nr:hypothetical protein [Euryarchaeota archaeon]